jgi:hypothetical protein
METRQCRARTTDFECTERHERRSISRSLYLSLLARHGNDEQCDGSIMAQWKEFIMAKKSDYTSFFTIVWIAEIPMVVGILEPYDA